MEWEGPAMQLTLDNDDTVLLRRILRSYLSDLRVEISNTDSYTFRQGLKEDEVRLKSLLDRIEAAAPSRPSH